MEKLATQILKDDYAEQDEAQRHSILEKLFRSFDNDRSGSLDEKEATVLVRVLHQKLRTRRKPVILPRNTLQKIATAATVRLSLHRRSTPEGREVDELVQRMHFNVAGGVTLEMLKAGIDDFLSWSSSGDDIAPKAKSPDRGDGEGDDGDDGGDAI